MTCLHSSLLVYEMTDKANVQHAISSTTDQGVVCEVWVCFTASAELLCVPRS